MLLLFGYPQIHIDDQPVEIKSRKGLALLAYLAVTQQPQSRDALAGLLWPDYDQTRARANLRRTLFNLNRTPVAGWLIRDGDLLILDAQLLSTVDVTRFEELTDCGGAEELEAAITLYQDDFLSGYFLPDSEPFDEWVTATRSRLQQTMLATLETLTIHHLEAGDWDSATEKARHQLHLDNLRESAWRQLMQAMAQDGRRSEALTAYAECGRIMMSELAVEPDPETVALAEAIRCGELTGAGDRLPMAAKTETADPANAGAAGSETHVTALPAFDTDDETIVPYRGLFAFREKDAPYFFGREEFTELLVTTVQEQSIVAVIGPSGSGKSSVVYAGLMAQLREKVDWLFATFRPGSRPFHSVANAFVSLLEPALGTTEQLVETRRLAKALEQGDLILQDVVERTLQQYGAANRVLLIADQFEELYTLCPDSALRHRFLDVLLEMVFAGQYQPSPIFTLVLTLRADFLGQALSHRALADAIQKSDVKLGPMTRSELTRAVANPARMQSVEFEAGLVTRILDDVGDEPGNLPLLEFSLASLWQQRTSGQIEHRAYDAIGRVDGALARHADEIFVALNAQEQAAARRIFIQLIRPGEGTEDTRRVALRHELGADDWALITRLASARLVVTGRDAAGQETVEVIHEALIRSWGQLREWMAEDRTFRVWQERLRAGLRQWEATNKDEGALLRGAPLAEAERWLTERRGDFSQPEQHFIRESLGFRERRIAEQMVATQARERLRRLIVAGLAAGLLVVFVLAGFSTWQWQRAERQRMALAGAQASVEIERDQAQIALSRQLAAQSREMIDDQHDLALLLGLQALNYANTPDAANALHTALAHYPELRMYIEDYENSVYGLALSADEQFLAVASQDRVIRLWDTFTGVQLREWATDGTARSVAISPDSRTVMAGSQTGIIHGWMIDGGEPLSPPIQAHEEFVRVLKFSPNGKVLVSGSDDESIKVWNFDAKPILHSTLTAPEQTKVFDLAVSPNSQIVAASTSRPQSAILLWELATGELLYTFPIRGNSTIRSARHLQFSIDGHLLAATDGFGKLFILDLAELRSQNLVSLQSEWTGHDSLIVALDFDGTTLTSIERDGILKEWNVEQGTLTEESDQGIPKRLARAVFSEEGELATTSVSTGRVMLWGTDTRVIELQGDSNPTAPVAFSSDGTMLAAGSDQWLYLLDPLTGEKLREPAVAEETHFIESLTFSPNGRTIASSDSQGRILLWDVASLQPHGEPLQASSEGYVDQIRLAFSPDGEMLLSAAQPNPFGKEIEVARWDLLSDTDMAIHSVISIPVGTIRSRLIPELEVGRKVSRHSITSWTIFTRHQPSWGMLPMAGFRLIPTTIHHLIQT